MAYEVTSRGKKYTLHTRNIKLRGGQEQRVYFFSGKKPKSGKPTDLPAGYKVVYNPRSGLPLLKKK